MLEAVNTSLQGSSVLRAKAEQVSSAESFAVNPQQVQRVAQAPFISPYIALDNGDTVVQFRDTATGKVLQQIPSQNNLQAQQQHDVVKEAESQQAPIAAAKQVDTHATPTTAHTDATDDTSGETSSSGGHAGGTGSVPVTNQQQTAFVNASRAGNANAGNITLFA